MCYLLHIASPFIILFLVLAYVKNLKCVSSHVPEIRWDEIQKSMSNDTDKLTIKVFFDE